MIEMHFQIASANLPDLYMHIDPILALSLHTHQGFQRTMLWHGECLSKRIAKKERQA